jgi:CHAT domain-containing protein
MPRLSGLSRWAVADVQALLRSDEALLFVLDTPEFGPTPEESFIWLVTKTEMHWVKSEFGTKALTEHVAALRCGLDASSWDDTSTWPQQTALDQESVREQLARRERCIHLLGLGASERGWPPFDLSRAHELYQALLAPFDDAIKGKHLMVVPSGALTSLPFHVLVIEKPDPALTGMAAYRQAAWLALRQPVTVLPSVASLQALRRLGPSKAAEPYIGFGNPLLQGASGNDRRAWDKQRCSQQPAPTRVTRKRDSGRGGVALNAISLETLRTREPLPETADEICAIAEALGVVANESDTVWLGERATERNLKVLSREGKLARYKVVHFATHGLLSGESAAILKARAEPALMLSPPQDGATAAELEDDNGLLTASEVAQLELDADWVVLSACNTAAGEKGNAEPLSGLARAFFYANARALLVSHWAVNSDAAAKLTTRTFAELKANPSNGRAEALRRAMAALIKNGQPFEAHPAMWASFALVGDGGSSSHVTGQSITSPPASSVPPAKGSARAKAKTGAQRDGDWKATIWKGSGS